MELGSTQFLTKWTLRKQRHRAIWGLAPAARVPWTHCSISSHAIFLHIAGLFDAFCGVQILVPPLQKNSGYTAVLKLNCSKYLLKKIIVRKKYYALRAMLRRKVDKCAAHGA